VFASLYQECRICQPSFFCLGGDTEAIVCPAGYILDLEKSVHADGARSGVCTLCKAGTYSLAPLKGGSSNQDPACLNCPLGGDCSLGGENVSFPLGSWTKDSGIFKLVGCPPGYQLQNKADGVTFSQDSQRCFQCSQNQYVVDSNDPNFSCNRCPVGAICNGSSLRGLVNRSVWAPDYKTGLYILRSCPKVQRINQHFDLFAVHNLADLWML
jgi:hypothetical protein